MAASTYAIESSYDGVVLIFCRGMIRVEGTNHFDDVRLVHGLFLTGGVPSTGTLLDGSRFSTLLV